jgi:GTPase involved in cell partitioning and DNA repair
MTSIAMLDRSLGDLRREITDLQQIDISHDYDMNKLCSIINISRDSLREMENFQQQLLNQLQQFEMSLADINQILRTNIVQKIQLENQQQQSGISLFFSMSFISKAAEIEKLANDELEQQAIETKAKQQEIERNRAAELERRVKLEEERQRLKVCPPSKHVHCI